MSAPRSEPGARPRLPLSDKTLYRAGTLGIIALGLVLAWAGGAPGVDSIVFYVFEIVDKIPWDPASLLAPIYNPPPMYTHAYRPLSTVLTKLGGDAFGHDLESLRWLTMTHALFLVPYGLAARRCLRVHGYTLGVATLAAVSTMALPTVLFSAWTIPEYDMVGGIWVLLAASFVRERRWAAAAPFLVLAVLTKETTAVFMFAVLLADGAAEFRARQGTLRQRLRAFTAAGVFLVGFLAVVSPILARRPEVTTDFNVSDDDFVWLRVAWLALHDGNQLLYSLAPAGVALLLAGVLLSERPGAAPGRLARYQPLAVGAALALPFAVPIVRFYNHYESIIFSNWEVSALAIVALLAALGASAWRRSEPDEGRFALAIVLGAGGLLVGPILASFSRADLSARLFAPVLPLLHGLVWHAAVRLVADGLRWRRGLAWASAAAFGWLPFAGAVNAWQFNAARFGVEVAAKQELLAALTPAASPDGRPPGCPMVFYTNRDQELAVEELARWGGLPESTLACVRLIQLATTELGPGSLWQQKRKLHGHDQFREEFKGEELEQRLRQRKIMLEPLHLYVQAARSTMSAEANAALDVSWDWAVRRMPETDVGYFEQAVRVIYTRDTALERFFQDAAVTKRKRSAAFVQLPLWPHELLWRMVEGVPAIETYHYAGATYSIPAGQRPLGAPEGLPPPHAFRHGREPLGTTPP